MADTGLVEEYLTLGLRLGRHIDARVDAYYGPPALAEADRRHILDMYAKAGGWRSSNFLLVSH